MTPEKTSRELAYLHDLFVATDWNERFSSLIDENLTLPSEGNALYVEAGTGNHAIALSERAGEKLKFQATDQNAESVELAKAKAVAAKNSTSFQSNQPSKLAFPADHFDLVIGNSSLTPVSELRNVVAELVRVAAAGGTVAVVLPTASSFGEFFSIYWEALHNSGLIDHEADVEHLILELPTVSDMEDLAAGNGLEEVISFTQPEEFTFESGEAFLQSPLISEFLMKSWLETVPEDARERVATEIVRIINEECHEAEFALTVKATLVVGQKSRSH
jgi:ubiquinone/menaquinone biosynthesis C-methylase UbiE